MAIVNLDGAEGGEMALVSSYAGAVGASTVQKRTGSYAYRCVPSASAGTANFRKFDANGRHTNLNGSTWVTFWLYIATLPDVDRPIACMGAAADQVSVTARVFLTTGGALRVENGDGSAQSSPAATLSTGQWYKIEFRAANGGTCGVAVNDGSEVTVTGSAQTVNFFTIGCAFNPTTMDLYYDDIVIDDAAFLSVDAKVEIMQPNADGNYTTWSASAGNKWDCVEEIPVTNTEYIESLTTAGTRRYSAALESAASAGITGTVHAVKAFAFMWEQTSTTTLGGMGMRCGGTDAETGDADIGNTSLVNIALVRTTNPADSAAFEPSDLDGLEVIVRRSTSDTSNIRCAGMYAEVLFTPAVNVTVTGVTATASADGGVATIATTRIATVAGALATAPAAALTGTIAAVRTATVAGEVAPATAAALTGAVLIARTVSGEVAAATAAALEAVIEALTGDTVIAGEAATAAAAALQGTVATVRIAAVAGEVAAATAAALQGTVAAQVAATVAGESAQATAAALQGAVATVRIVAVVGVTATATGAALEGVIATQLQTAIQGEAATAAAAALAAVVAAERIAAIAGALAVALAAANEGEVVITELEVLHVVPMPGVGRGDISRPGASRGRTLRPGRGEV